MAPFFFCPDSSLFAHCVTCSANDLMAEFPDIFACVSCDKVLFIDEDERTLEKYPARSAVMSTPRRMSCKGRRRRKEPARKLQRMMRWMQRRQSRRKPSQPPMKRLKRHHPSTSRMKRRCRLTSQSSLHPRHPTRQRQTAKRNRSSRSPRWTMRHRRIWNCRMCLPA